MVVLLSQVAAARARLTASYSVEAELVFVALVLVAWQAIRIPLEGSVAVSLDHSGSILRLEDALGLDVEASFIGRASEAGVVPVLAWLYANIHIPVLFSFMAAARLLAPERYPRLRTIFVVSFVPAILVIGLYPLAPPRWLPSLGLGPTPTQADLATSGALFHNETAAAASQHFGFAVFVAAAAVWLFPRSRLASATIAYPVLVFLVVVCTGHHYVFDCVVGTLTVVFASGLCPATPRALEQLPRAPVRNRHGSRRTRLRAHRVGAGVRRRDGAGELEEHHLRGRSRGRRRRCRIAAARREGSCPREWLVAAETSASPSDTRSEVRSIAASRHTTRGVSERSAGAAPSSQREGTGRRAERHHATGTASRC